MIQKLRKLIKVVTIAILSMAVFVVAQTNSGTFTDDRDNQVYHIVKIGNQVWMAENLNYATASGSWCYDDDPANCDIYGRLYDWATAMGLESSCNSSSCASQIQTNHRGVCPSGWRLPTDAEWGEMVAAVEPGCSPTITWCSSAGTKLKSETGWEPWDGVPFVRDYFGFSALPGGVRWDGSFGSVGLLGFWWTATESSATDAWYRSMYYDFEVVIRNANDKANGFSVRCVRN